MASYWSTVWLLFNLAGYEHANVTASDDNPVLHTGYNVAEGGGVDDVDADPWAFADSLEGNYQPGDVSYRWFERHWQAWGPGVSVRPLSLVIQKDANAWTHLRVASDLFSVTSSDNVGRLAMYTDSAGVGLFYVGAWDTSGSPGAKAVQIRVATNNSPALLQANNGSPYATYSTLLKYDSNNTIIMGDSTVNHVKWATSNPPEVDSCDALITALDAMGLVEDTR